MIVCCIILGCAPIIPFLSTIAKQRGISVFLIGIIFTFMHIFNIIVRPITGFVTDRWRCRKQMFLGTSLVNSFFTLFIYLAPGFDESGKTSDSEILKQWKFWLFLTVITIRSVLWMVGDVLQDTICLEILGRHCVFNSRFFYGFD